uniref:(northern house mosquito) hypothetical protein n=1 Tax=Culex pipiens TaxID=7175 RepID=A0A8D8DN06_CULPI
MAGQGKRHSGPGCDCRRLYERHDAPPARADSVLDFVSVGQEGASPRNHLLDAVPLCPLGRQPTARSISEAVDGGAVEAYSRCQQTRTGGGVFCIRNPRGGSMYGTGAVFGIHSKDPRVCVRKISAQKSTDSVRRHWNVGRLGRSSSEQTGIH